MHIKLKGIFPKEWEFIVDRYIHYIRTVSKKKISINNIIKLIEIGVIFGEKIFSLGFSDHTEIGCGFAIPSLTIYKLGGKKVNVRAYDFDLTILEYAKQVKDECHSNISLECMDFYFKKGEVKENEIWVTEKPRSLSSFKEFESEILDETIKKNINIAIIPFYNLYPKDRVNSYVDKCKNICDQLCQAGYKVETCNIIEDLPLRCIIGLVEKKYQKNPKLWTKMIFKKNHLI